MASPSHSLESPPAGPGPATSSSTRPLSGHGAARQTRRLQLRNAGFRAAAVPPRRVSPTSFALRDASGSWAGVNGLHKGVNGHSDEENMEPETGFVRSASGTGERAVVGGILQEIGNESMRRRRGTGRSKGDAEKAFGVYTEGRGGVGEVEDGLSSPPPPKEATLRSRVVKSRTKNASSRRSVSGEASKYIEHLEGQLLAAESRISSITSPSVTRQQNAKLRTLNVQARQLQEQIDEWENKYEVRVQEEIDRHCQIETGLKGRIRTLEENAEELKMQILELEEKVERSTDGMEMAETANVNLEKRLEIISELLAASPSRVDLHVETPGKARRLTRPQSMLPRFPTAGSFVSSPKRPHSQTIPTSPTNEGAAPHLNFSASFGPMLEPLNISPTQSDSLQDSDSVFDETPATAENFEFPSVFEQQQSQFNPWSAQTQQHAARSKPTRRMRRFCGGGTRPKSLILPSTTSHGDHLPPASAPPQEVGEKIPVFPPPTDIRIEGASPVSSRRRASTMSDERLRYGVPDTSLLHPLPLDLGDDRLVSSDLPGSAESQATTRNMSSLGPVSKNLMDELNAARSCGMSGSAEGDASGLFSGGADSDLAQKIMGETAEASLFNTHMDSSPSKPDAVFPSRKHPETTTSTSPTARRRSHSAPPTSRHDSFLARLRNLLSNLYQAPLTLARHLIQTAQTRMHLPQPLLRVQWWIVGVLIGPMARRRLQAQHAPPPHPKKDDDAASSSEGEECTALLPATPTLLLPEHSPREHGYGALTPAQRNGPETPCPATHRTASLVAGKGKKRATVPSHSPSPGLLRGGRARRRGQAAREGLLSRHSPWVWLRFTVTLVFAVGTAFWEGPGALLGEEGDVEAG